MTNPIYKKIVETYLHEVNSKHKLILLDDIIHPDYVGGVSLEQDEVKGLPFASYYKMFWTPDQLKLPGIAGIKTRVGSLIQQLGTNITILNYYDDESSAYVRTITRFHHQSEFMGFAPTNKVIQIMGSEYFEFKENKIIHMNFVLDFLKFLQEIGLAVIEENDQQKIDSYMNNLRTLNILPKEMN